MVGLAFHKFLFYIITQICTFTLSIAHKPTLNHTNLHTTTSTYTTKAISTLVKHSQENSDDTVDVHLKNVSLYDCALHTYNWSTEECNFDGGKAILTYNWFDFTDQEKKEFLEYLKNSNGIGTDSCTLTHGGGTLHSSLKNIITCNVYGGIHHDWLHLHNSLRDEKWDVDITEIKLDFGNKLEEFYQDGENDWLDS